MQHINTVQKITTTIDFRKMATPANNYDRSLPHPMGHEIEFISHDGTKVSLYVGQIATLVAIANKMPNAGKAIDYMFSALEQEQITEICRKY